MKQKEKKRSTTLAREERRAQRERYFEEVLQKPLPLSEEDIDAFRDLPESSASSYFRKYDWEISARKWPADSIRLLHFAAAIGATEIVCATLEQVEVDLNALDTQGTTVLHEAARHGQIPVVEALLARNADPNRRAAAVWQDQTALHMVLDEKHSLVAKTPYRAAAVVKTLLEGHASAVARCANGRIPLHYAAETGNKRAALLLLDGRARTAEAPDNRGSLPLHLAATSGAIGIIRALLRESGGKGIFQKDREDRRPLGIFIQHHCAIEESDKVAALANLKASSLLDYSFELPSPALDSPSIQASVLSLLNRQSIHAELVRFLIRETSRRDARNMFSCTILRKPEALSIGRPPYVTQSIGDAISTALRTTYFPQRKVGWVHFPICSTSWVRELHFRLYLQQRDCEKTITPHRFSHWLDRIHSASSFQNEAVNPLVEVSQFLTPRCFFISLPILRLCTYRDQVVHDWCRRRQYTSTFKNDSTSRASNPDPYVFERYGRLLHMDSSAFRYATRFPLHRYYQHPRGASIRDERQITLRLTSSSNREMSIDPTHSEFEIPKWSPADADRYIGSLTGSLVVVEALHVWVLGSDLVVTSINDALVGMDSGTYPAWDVIPPPDNIGQHALAAYIIQEYVAPSNDKVPDYLTYFRRAVNYTGDQQTKQLRAFSEAIRSLEAGARKPGRSSARGQSSSDEIADTQAPINNLCDVADIRDELQIMQGILQQQLNVVSDYEDAWNAYCGEGAQPRFRTLQSLIRRRRAKMESMAEEAARIHGDILQLLDLKQKQATIMESRFARWEAESTARQASVITVFTVVTVVFLPASFMATFLAIPDLQIPGFAGSLGQVAAIIVVTTVVISAPLIFLAFNAAEAKDRLRGWRAALTERRAAEVVDAVLDAQKKAARKEESAGTGAKATRRFGLRRRRADDVERLDSAAGDEGREV